MSTRDEQWHVGEHQLQDYVSGTAARAVVASVEAHLLRCVGCRAALGRAADAPDRTAAWERLADTIDRPSGRLLPRLARGDGLLRASVATPAMVAAALAAVLLVGIVPLLAAFAAPGTGLVALLVAAPLAPSAAVAIAYRDWADPAGEISLATPAAGVRLVALRATAVSLVALPAAVAVLFVLDRLVTDVPLSFGVAWCLPGLALAAVVLAAGTTRLDPGYVALVLGGSWAVTVVTVVRLRRSLQPEQFVDLIAGPGVQLAALAVLVTALALTSRRRTAATSWRTA